MIAVSLREDCFESACERVSFEQPLLAEAFMHSESAFNVL